MRIPADEIIVILYDDTLLKSNKDGVAFGRRGVYGKSLGTPLAYINWKEFASGYIKNGFFDTNIAGKDFHFSLHGDSIINGLVEFRYYLRKKYF